MAMAMESGKNSRFTDIFDEPVGRHLAPIKGYEDQPLVSLPETIKPISKFFNEIEDYVYVALQNCQNPADGLTQQESAAIHLYTMQFHGGPSLYLLLNQALRAEDRDQLKPWFSFLKLFLTALHKLPSERETVWRGIRNVDFSVKYKTGTKFAWWGVSSCTTNIEVLESKQFLGKHGQRTLFLIDCVNGKSIVNHSYFKDKEKEMTLMPGSYFEVIRQLNPAPELHIIQIKEIPPPITFIKPPFDKPVHTNPAPEHHIIQITEIPPPATFVKPPFDKPVHANPAPEYHIIQTKEIPLVSTFVKPPFDKPIHPNPPSVTNKSGLLSQLMSKVTLRSTTSGGFSRATAFKSNAKWSLSGITIAGGNDSGNQLNQLYYPYNLFIDDDQTIYIVDHLNDRIVQWKSNAHDGRIMAGGNGKGNQTNQLNSPTDVVIDKEFDSLIIADRGNKRVMRWSRKVSTNAEIIISNIDCWGLTMDKNGSLYISDYLKNEVKRWKIGEKNGTIVAGGNGAGNHLDQFNGPTSIFIDEDYSLYVADSENHRVMKWLHHAKVGIIVAGGNGEGKSSRQLSCPFGVTVDQFGLIYVADFNNHRVMCWSKENKEGTIIVGGNGEGSRANQFSHPRGLSFDRDGHLYVVDCWNNRIQKFAVNRNENHLLH